MSIPAFYVTGGTLRQDGASYVERQADKDRYEGLQRGEFCYVLTSRQMGKSSLMVHTATRLRGNGTAVVVLDLTAIGQNLKGDIISAAYSRDDGRTFQPARDPLPFAPALAKTLYVGLAITAETAPGPGTQRLTERFC